MKTKCLIEIKTSGEDSKESFIKTLREVIKYIQKDFKVIEGIHNSNEFKLNIHAFDLMPNYEPEGVEN